MARSISIVSPPPYIVSLPEAAQGFGFNEYVLQPPESSQVLLRRSACRSFPSTLMENGVRTVLELYPRGCNYIDDHGTVHRNCTIACQQPELVWDNMRTFHNCLAYPAVSQWLSNDNDLDQKSIDAALEMGFVPYFNLTHVEDPVQGCLQSFYAKSADDKAECWGKEYKTPQAIAKAACDYFHPSPNLDIGGIGAYLSYLIQLGILAYAYLHTRIMSTWASWIAWLIYLVKGRKKADQKALEVQNRVDDSHQQAALLSSLVEFQKAQSYFALTLQGSAIAALAGSGAMFDADSFRQLRLTVYLLGDVAVTGIVCITSGLYILHNAGKQNGYTTLLSVLAYFVSLVVWIQTRLPLHSLGELTMLHQDLPACGYKSPATYCAADLRPVTIFESVAIALCSLTLLMVVILQRTRLSDYKWETLGMRHWVPEAVEAIHAGFGLAILVQMITNGEMKAVGSEVQWTFAQLLSVTIWAPLIVEYVYAAARGVKAMQEHRVFDEEDE
ncbi:Hypothetical predicted protein [Lecanosticta acicola]|uniref:Uncharacterized protein n=1 Tax=Lecanosticta acicola TaxID=111012 RepID=A0AAI8Z4X4_9PEZI|nr:Hypothetical predicted protein [Lecanosticta acicola]